MSDQHALARHHKTIVGLFAGVVAAVVVTWGQACIGWQGAPVNYVDWIELGLYLGGGAMVGDSAKRFFKRRFGVRPGKPWVPRDQLDFVLGALVFVVGRAALSWRDVAAILLLSAGGGAHRGQSPGLLDRRERRQVVVAKRR